MGGVTVIVLGMASAAWIQNLDEAVSVLLRTNTLGKGANPTDLSNEQKD